jgi:hypothetical protein
MLKGDDDEGEGDVDGGRAEHSADSLGSRS